MKNKFNMYLLEKKIGGARVIYNKVFFSLSHAIEKCFQLNEEKRGGKFYVKEVVFLNDTQSK